jgi:RHS repeat-associated protein
VAFADAASHSSLLAAVAAADVVSATTTPSETRVRGIDLAGDGGTWDSTLASAETHWASTYSYGELAADRQEVTNLRLPGQYDERLFAAAGLSGLPGPYYNWNRWYLPGVGRYLELDPLALGGRMNGPGAPDWYNYALGNPLRFTDREGTVAGVDDGALLAGMGIVLLIEYLRACTATNTCPWSPSPQCSQPKKPWVWNPPRPNPIPLPIPPEIKGPCAAEVDACFQRHGNWRQCLDCEARCIGLGGIWPPDPRC